MFNFIKTIIKTLLFIFFGVPILLMCWNFISNSSLYLDQSSLTLEPSASSDGASKEEQIAELEQKIRLEKLTKREKRGKLLSKAGEEGNLARDKVLNSDFVYLNNIHQRPIATLTKTEKALLIKRLEGEIVKFTAFIAGSRAYDISKLYKDSQENIKTAKISVTDTFWFWDYSIEEAVYCTFRLFDLESRQNFLKLNSNEWNRFEKFTIKGKFESIKYTPWALTQSVNNEWYGRKAKHRINLKDCIIM